MKKISVFSGTQCISSFHASGFVLWIKNLKKTSECFLAGFVFSSTRCLFLVYFLILSLQLPEPLRIGLRRYIALSLLAFLVIVFVFVSEPAPRGGVGVE